MKGIGPSLLVAIISASLTASHGLAVASDEPTPSVPQVQFEEGVMVLSRIEGAKEGSHLIPKPGSQLIVTTATETSRHSFPPGCKLVTSVPSQGFVGIRCPSTGDGALFDEAVFIYDFKKSTRDLLSERVVYLVENAPPGTIVGVRLTKPIAKAKPPDRELFVIAYEKPPKGARTRTLAKGSWLPSENDLELEQDSAKRDQLNASFRDRLQIRDGTLIATPGRGKKPLRFKLSTTN